MTSGGTPHVRRYGCYQGQRRFDGGNEAMVRQALAAEVAHPVFVNVTGLVHVLLLHWGKGWTRSGQGVNKE